MDGPGPAAAGPPVRAVEPSTVRALFGDDARRALRAGARQLADAVSVTLGPRGRSVCIANDYLSAEPYVTKDGATVARAFALRGPEGVGADMVRSACLRADSRAGDGTTTATLLAAEVVDAGMAALGRGTRVASLQRGIQRAVGDVERALRALARPVRGPAELAAVAALSANGDRRIGELVARALVEPEGAREGATGAGPRSPPASPAPPASPPLQTPQTSPATFSPPAGVVAVELSPSPEDSLEITRGYTLESGALSPHFLRAGSELVLRRPYVLVSEERLISAADVMPALVEAARARRDLLVVAPDVAGDALSSLVANAAAGAVNCCAVRATGMGDVQLHQLGDLAAFCGAGGAGIAPGAASGATPGIAPGIAPPTRRMGWVEKALVTRDRAVLFPGPEGGEAKDAPGLPGTPPAPREERIRARVAELRAQLQDPALSPYQREKLQARIGRLLARVAVIRVGGATDLEARERRDRYLDALSAGRAALTSGCLPGGGVALLRVSDELLRRAPGGGEGGERGGGRGDSAKASAKASAKDPTTASAKTSTPTPGPRSPAADEEAGYRLLLRALGRVAAKIVENAGEDPEEVVPVILGRREPASRRPLPGLSALGASAVSRALGEGRDASGPGTVSARAVGPQSPPDPPSPPLPTPRPFSFGFDAARLDFCDLAERGIVDATDVVVEALRSAASVGAAILSTDALVLRS